MLCFLQRKRLCIAVFNRVCLLFFAFSTAVAFSQQQWRIDEIEFVGNQFFSEDVLSAVLYTRATEYSLSDRFLLSFSHLVRTTRSPVWLKRVARRVESEIYQARIRYYNPATVEQDRQQVQWLYNAYGFHDVEVSHHFFQDTARKKNILKIVIEEGERARIDTIVLLGIETVPENLQQQISSLFHPLIGAFSSTGQLTERATQARTLLQEHGYFFASVDPPFLSYHAKSRTDSVTIRFYPGKRYRIADVRIQLDTRGQKPVSRKLIESQILLRKGEWFRLSNLVNTENRLRQLGEVFDFVAVDTVYVPELEEDSLLVLKIQLRMRKTETIEAGLFYSKYPFATYWDLGGQFQYQHRNIFGAAQLFHYQLSGVLRDPIGVFTGTVAPYYELRTGIGLRQPYLFTIGRYPVAAQGEFVAAQQFVTRQLQLQLLQLQLALPMTLSPRTFVQAIAFRVNMQRIKPLNFAEAYRDALQTAQTAEDSMQVVRQLFLYSILDTVMNIEGSFFTTSALEIQLTGDTRNHPFYPTSGYAFSTTIESAGLLPGTLKGNSEYLRLDFFAAMYHRIARRWVFAVKQRFGHIFWLDTRSYVPLEKHYFAGGANSLRAWQSRKLSADDLTYTQSLQGFTDVVGGATLIEGSAEFRFRFPQSKSPATFIETILDKILGWTLFVDWGNMFNSFVLGPENYGKSTILPNIALDAGIGIRLGTESIPPIRIDLAFPVYDPTKSDKKFFLSEISSLPFRWQIAIGEAF